jgi:hypothetical protein
MPSNYTSNLGLEKQADGENDGTWGTKRNTGIDQTDEAISGIASVTITASGITLDLSDGIAGENGRHHTLDIGGTPTGTPTMVVPNIEKTWIMRNDSGRPVSIKTATGSAITLASGKDDIIQCDGANTVRQALADSVFGPGQALETSDTPTFAGIELGHASDTTIARVSAGEISVEGAQLAKESTVTALAIALG